MKEEKLKQAFSKIKEDIFSLGEEINEIRQQLLESNHLMKQINKEIIKLKLEKITENQEKLDKKQEKKISTHLKETSTHPATSTDNSTHPQEIQGLKSPNLDISTGNQGVSTDRQTDKQTVRHIISDIKTQKIEKLPTTRLQETHLISKNVVPKEQPEQIVKPIAEQISEASEIIDSLDNIKKDIRQKFRNITKQEMLVFSTIYQLEEQGQSVDYKKLALKLSLSQSSIRDYTQRMMNKGIPIIKEKFNNKKIILHISPELKKIASLDTIIKLREINSFRA